MGRNNKTKVLRSGQTTVEITWKTLYLTQSVKNVHKHGDLDLTKRSRLTFISDEEEESV